MNLFWGVIILMSILACVFVARPLLQTANGTRHPMTGILIIITLPIVALLFYLQFGSSNKLGKFYFQQQQAKAADQMRARLGTPTQILAALKQHLAQDPNSARGWFLLGRLYSSLNQHSDAEQAFAKAYQLSPSDNDVMFQYAQSMYLIHHTLDGRANQLLQKILQQDPHYVLAINLYAAAAFQAQQYQTAILYWEQLLPEYPPNSADGQALLEMIGKAQTALAKQKR